MKTIILFTILFTILFSLSNANAQGINLTGEIAGKVLDEKQAAFPYASVSLLNAKDSTLVKGTLSNDSGNYLLTNIKQGAYLIAIYVVGYKKAYKGPYAITATNQSHKLDATQLNQDSKQLKGVEILRQKPLIERMIDKTVINVENSTLTTGNSALDILEKLPGVTVDKDGKVSLKGKQGVNIMLDGKPTYLSSEQLANLLRTTEGSAIQSIELIPNPSAKYDAAGNSGIINIKLKKNQNYGTNGSVDAGLGYGKYYKASGGLTLNHREKKFNVFGNFYYGRNKRYSGTDIMRTNNTATNKTYFDQTNYNLRIRNNINYKGGIDYFINDKSTIGFSFNGYKSDGKNASDVLTLIGDQPSETDSSVVAKNPNDYKYTGISYNLNYKGTIDTLGQEISVDADYSNYTGMENNNFNNRYLDAQGQTLKPAYLFRNATPTKTNIKAIKADYIYPINKKMKLEAGIKSSFVKTDNNFIFENFENNEWINDNKRSNQFLYDENINAVYSNLTRKFKTTSVQLGLRAEQTNSKGNSITDNKIVSRHYINLFPSVFINQTLSKDHDMGFSYSRRIDRPDYESLNPFVDYLDLYSYRFGNPFLKPQYTNSFEVSYTYKKNLNITFGYSRTTDVISNVLLTDTIKKTIFISNENLTTQDSYNMNITYPIKITNWWNSSNNLNVYYNKYRTPDLLGSPYESGKIAFHLNTTQTITLNSTTNVELSGNYESKQVAGTLLLDPQYNVDFGVKKSLMDKKMDIKLAVNDVFKTQGTKITSAIPSQHYVIKERWESRIFRLSCTYRFGSKDIKAATKRSSSSEAEEKRVKSGG
ncbi:outer membrane beta-barrel family protein [Pedobacter hiemivivus]|uniref:TonB-dependent receptor n=1 Tax=Pedobacter hiemivivus TaxID=2530454 RepID=A0A4R0N7L3_9SPHI|nr:outer membrane beta-barrel family protein [Pedobacter hiemivivus]TCC96098.1 TonB-dependent receptor [Pedobacter hiemivivus]